MPKKLITRFRSENTMKHTIVRFSVFFSAFYILVLNSIAYAEGPRLENIIVTNTRDDLLLYLTAKNAFPPKIAEAIQSGVPTTFTYYVNLYRVRNMWMNKKITDIELTHSLKYDTLKKEYVVTRSWERDRPLIVKSFDEAKELMSEVDSLKIVPLSQLEKGQQYQIRTKAELDRMTLRFYLHYVLFFLSFWDVETDWYTIDFIY